MSTLLWIGVALFWVGCGVLCYGIALADFWDRFSILRDGTYSNAAWYRSNFFTNAICFGLIPGLILGPIWVVVCYLMSCRAAYGVRFFRD